MRFARSVQAARDRDYSGIDSYGQQGTGQNERESTAGTRNTSLLLIQIFFWLFSVIYETIWSSPGLSIGLLVALLRSYPMLDQYICASGSLVRTISGAVYCWKWRSLGASGLCRMKPGNTGAEKACGSAKLETTVLTN